ncbi:MAG: two-component regulator propeller domain-containing protein [Bacteroidota bacterium]|nr:two-component regulator propeller domain-containing protein [Bacteroidota bacterium]
MRTGLFIIFILLFLLPLEVFSQWDDTKFRHISVNEGLSDPSVVAIEKDDKGFMWFGTRDGLNRYDGYEFKIFKHQKNKNSLTNNYISCIYKTSDGLLWIGSKDGLNRYNPETGLFTGYKKNGGRAELSSGAVNGVVEDSDKNIWIATENGLNRLNPRNNEIEYFLSDSLDNKSIAGNNVLCLFKDNTGTIWAGTSSGLSKFDKDKKAFTNYYGIKRGGILSANQIQAITQDRSGDLWLGTRNGVCRFNPERETATNYFKNNQNNSLSLNYIRAIAVDNKNRVWIGTYDDGINIYDINKDKFFHLYHNLKQKGSLSHNNIRSLFVGKSGNIWIGNYNGINIYLESNQYIKHYSHNPYEEESLSNNTVWAFTEDVNQNLWIGTTDGLNKLDSKTGKITRYFHQKSNPNSISNNTIDALYCDSKNILWIGTWGGGLNRMDLNTGINKVYKYDTDNSKSISSNHIRKIMQDSEGNIWIGTYQGGLNKFNPTRETFERFTHRPNDSTSITNNTVWDIEELFLGELWITTEKGINILDLNTLTFKSLEHDDENDNSLAHDFCLSILKDQAGNIWIGSYGGLDKYNPKTGKFTDYTKKQGLPNNIIYGICEDSKSNLWLSTNEGISKYNRKLDKFKNFGVNDGLQSSKFNKGAYFKAADGMIAFGGINGFNTFYPQNIKNNKIPPKVVITSLKILNKEIVLSEDSPIKKVISYTDSIEISYKDNVFTFEFSALHYKNPKKNKYKYKLENFDENWIETSSKNRRATYTNLIKGDYIFKVTAANSDNVKSVKPAQICIKVLPPYWETWWFRILTATLILVIIYVIYKIRIKQIEKQKNILEQKVHDRTKEVRDKNEELYQQKDEIIKQANQLQKTNLDLKKLSVVADKTDNAVLITDNKGEFIWVNNGYEKMYGFTLEELKSDISSNILSKDLPQKPHELVLKCFNEKISVQYNLKLKKKSGEDIWIQSALTPILDDGGEIKNLIAINTDITSVKSTERKMIMQRDQIKKHNKHIQSGIKYANSIQQAFLPLKSELNKLFENFLIYKPKDIVSGDFYWYLQLPAKENVPQKTFVVVSDCTGHGVPGAFMSMVGMRLLDEIVRFDKIHNPKEIISELDARLNTSLKQQTTKNRDGMDLALISITEENNNNYHLVFSGAKRDLYIVKGSKNLERIKGTRRSVGGNSNVSKRVAFENKEVVLNKGDLVYLLTDGIIDQSNKKRKRFGSVLFENILSEAKSLSLQQQKEILEYALQSHQKNEMQRDDITVLGIRL